MEEKKSIKISLKTYLISMFLMLLVIGILLGYILQTGENINKEITEKNNNKSETVVVEDTIETEITEDTEADTVVVDEESDADIEAEN